MPASVFLDTNVLVYAFDRSAPRKREIALNLIQGDREWSISWQVVQEFCNVALHRFASPMAPSDLADFLDIVLLPRCHSMPTAELYRRALGIQQQTGYRYYDSLVVTAALLGGASQLLSEDLQDGRRIATLQIRNPFI